MKANRRTLIVLCCLVVCLGFVAWKAYRWGYARWQRNIMHETLRQLHIAVEQHYMTKYRYPAAITWKGDKIGFANGYTLGRAPRKLIAGRRLRRGVLREAKRTRYCSDGQFTWILSHPGPDKQIDVDLVGWVRDASGDLDLYLQLHPEGLVEYDPSNGSVSRGDIWRTGP